MFTCFIFHIVIMNEKVHVFWEKRLEIFIKSLRFKIRESEKTVFTKVSVCLQ